MKDGHDSNRSSIASGIHKSERLHSDKKENRNKCKLRRRSDKNDSKESSITYIYNPSPQAYKLKNYRALLLKTLSALQPLKNTPPPSPLQNLN
jgi:hypothetical protein